MQLRIGQGLGVIGARAGIGGAAEILRVGRVDEAGLDALSSACWRTGSRSAVKIGRADDIVAGVCEVQDGERRCRLPGRQRQGGDPTLDGGDALFEDVGGGVHDAGIDVSQLLQGEQIRGMLGVAELIGGGLVDRHRDRVRGRVSAAAAMQDQGFGMTAIGSERRPSSTASAGARGRIYSQLSDQLQAWSGSAAPPACPNASRGRANDRPPLL